MFCHSNVNSNRNVGMGDGEMPQWLRTLGAFVEDSDSSLSIHTEAYSCL